MGRPRVLSINRSVCLSSYWLRAQEPQARKKTPETAVIISLLEPCFARTKPAEAEKAAKRAILNFVSSKMIFTQCFINHEPPSEL
jgi:hypothetical protein